MQIEEVEESGWKLGTEFLVEFKFAGACQFVELVAQCVTDSLDAVELVFLGKFHDLAIEISNGLSALPVGADLEGVVALEFQKQGDFLKDFCQIFSRHAGSVA